MPDQRRQRRLTAVELFSGAGGMALGFEQAGFDVLAAVELDPIHLAAHERNFPLCEPLCRDVSDLDADDLLAAARRGWARRHPESQFAGPVDCVFGGPSCQGFSVIGPRNRSDPRNELVMEFARCVALLRPRWFALENVPGLISPAYRGVLDEMRARLASAGYRLGEPWKLNARDHGVPQERKRVFVVGAREGEPIPIMPEAISEPPTVSDALRDLASLGRFRSLLARDALDLREDQLSAMQAAQSAYVRRLNGVDADPRDLADPRSWDPRQLTSVGLVQHSTHVVERFRRMHHGSRDAVGRLPKLDPDRQSPTLRAGTGRDHGSFTSARPVHYAAPRVISVREAARLHGFPDWFGFHATKWHGFRQVGNAVPPPLARAVAGTIVAAANAQPGRGSSDPVELGDNHLLALTLTEAADRYDLDASKLPPDVRAATKRRAKEAA